MPPTRSGCQPGFPNFCPPPVNPHTSHPSPSLLFLSEIQNSRALSYPLLQSQIILSLATEEPQIYDPNLLRSIPELALFPNLYLTQWNPTPSLGQQHQPSSTAALSHWVCSGSCEKGTWIVTHLACHCCPQPCGSLGMRVTWLTFPCRNAQHISGFSALLRLCRRGGKGVDWGFLQEMDSGERQELLPWQP